MCFGEFGIILELWRRKIYQMVNVRIGQDKEFGNSIIGSWLLNVLMKLDLLRML